MRIDGQGECKSPKGPWQHFFILSISIDHIRKLIVKTIFTYYLQIACWVGFRALAPSTQTTHIIFVMLGAPLISNLAPNSKQGKRRIDHCGFFYAFKINIPHISTIWIKVVSPHRHLCYKTACLALSFLSPFIQSMPERSKTGMLKHQQSDPEPLIACH